LYTKRHNTKPGIIVITLESSFDSKNLVGTYVCNETGEFQFKKGPLTVAAEQGMWLILRNIEETPSDLLSFLLPLVQENSLQVTSTMTIRPTLGFRLCFLRKTSEYGHDDIKPLTDLLYISTLDSLTER
jgi:midasin (ATPase involved in ribosome maturation)